jgi:chromosome partitioning protein
MPKIISVINLKGGVAKTTTTVQLAECLASEFSKRVLVIDLDPQTNSTISLIDEERWEALDEDGKTLFQLFNDKIEKTKVFDISSALQKRVSNLRLQSLDLLPSSIRFIDIQDRIAEIPAKTGYSLNPMEILKNAVLPILPNYDYVLIDCPPNLGFITRNGIEISDYYLVPSIPDTLSTYGIPQIVKTINKFTEERPALKIKCLGLVITKYDSRSSAHTRGVRDLPTRFAKTFSDLDIPAAPVLKTIMPQANVTAAAMQFSQVPENFRTKYGKTKSGDYYLYEYVISLTKEIIEHAK